jgi:3-oxoacyl-[acyl-carrier-protein] synthase II
MYNGKSRRVVVTGMGVMSASGQTVDEFWESILAGKSAISTLSMIDPEQQSCKVAGEMKDFNPEKYIDKKVARRMDRYTQLAMAAAKTAYQDSGLEPDSVEPHRFGVAVGTGSGGFGTIEQQVLEMQRRGNMRCSPFSVPMMLCNMGTGTIAIAFNAQGPSLTVVTACATGSDSIGNAFRMIQNDEADVILAGASEAPITSLAFAGFSAARALSTRNEFPESASRPFDTSRDGFVMAEGAGILVLEEYEHAKARGAKIYGELLGYGRSTDAQDLVKPPIDGSGLAIAINAALRDSALKPADIQYINAHATSTPLGDVAETNAIKSIFGENGREDQLLISATKSMTGHLLGASGAIEAIISLLSIRDKVIPPTINLDAQDPDCVSYEIPSTAKKLDKCRFVMSNSAGFGGHNAALVFGECLS